jgi:hypothetical protein
MHLHVITPTDITNEIGTMIKPQFYIRKEASSGKSTVSITTSFPKPSKSTWTYWKQLLDKYVIPNSGSYTVIIKPWVEHLQIIQREQETPPEWTDSDIIELICQKVLPNGEFKHVKGHQKISNNSDHTIKSVLNNWVDDTSNKAITSNNKTKTPENIARVVINNKRIFIRTQIIAQCTEKASKAYHTSKYGDKAYHQIDWDLYQKIVSNFTKSMLIIKMIHSLTPTIVQ